MVWSDHEWGWGGSSLDTVVWKASLSRRHLSSGSWIMSRYYFTNSRCCVIESWSLLLQKALPQEMTNHQHLLKECLLSKLFCNSALILKDGQESWRGKGNPDRIEDTSLRAGVGVGDQLVLRPHLFLLFPLWWLYLEAPGIWASTGADVASFTGMASEPFRLSPFVKGRDYTLLLLSFPVKVKARSCLLWCCTDTLFFIKIPDKDVAPPTSPGKSLE